MNHLSITACALLLMVAPSLSAQESTSTFEDSSPEIRIGISGGLTRNIHTDVNPLILGELLFPFFEDADPTWGHSAGLVATWSLTERTGLKGTLLYSTRPGLVRSTSATARVVLPDEDDPGSPTIVDQSVTTTNEIQYDLYELALLYTNDLLSTDEVGLGLAVGASLASASLFTQTVEQHFMAGQEGTFENPENLRTREDGQVLIHLKEAEVYNASSTRLSARLGAYFDLTLLDPICITQGVYYDHGLTSAVSGMPWKVHSLLFQVDVTVRI